MSQVLDTVLQIRDNISSPYWSARRTKQHDKFIFEILDSNNKRVGVFAKGNDALVASVAPAVLDRWVFLLEMLHDMRDVIFSIEHNQIILDAQNEDVKKVWSEISQVYKQLLGQAEQCLNLSVDEILISRGARYDEYEEI